MNFPIEMAKCESNRKPPPLYLSLALHHLFSIAQQSSVIKCCHFHFDINDFHSHKSLGVYFFTLLVSFHRDSTMPEVLTSEGPLVADEPDLSIFENKSGLAEDLKFLASMPELCDVTFLVGETREPVCAVKVSSMKSF